MFDGVLFKRIIKAVIYTALFLVFIPLKSQELYYDYFYRITFKDKGETDIGSFSASSLLSERATERREKSGIPFPDIYDIPVNRDYLNGIESLGLVLHSASKWMNTGLFKTNDKIDPAAFYSLWYVKDVKLVRRPSSKSANNDKLDFPVLEADDFPYDRPLTMVSGNVLHASGFDGKGVLIAVLDGGFMNADKITSLQNLRQRKGIKGTYDFVRNDEFVYGYHNHGTAVLSVIAGVLDNQIRGSAPGADFLLLRTEDTESEYSVEEDFWAAAAEYADSAGADIISSSLGYYNFDDPSLDYSFSDMDGNTTFVTRAADIAASKGILVVSSAGNERNKTWLRIIAPSDGDSVIASGAVDGYNNIAVFSSAGPSSDGRVKPDLTTMGVRIPVQVDVNTVTRSSGTSFSCPVLSGMAACLMQAVPSAVNTTITRALHESAAKYSDPDSLYGYGIPDMLKTLAILQDIYVSSPLDQFITGPNPTNGEIEIIFREDPGEISIELYNAAGIIIYSENIPQYAGRTFKLNKLLNSNNGLYFLRIRTDSGIFTRKIIKFSNR